MTSVRISRSLNSAKQHLEKNSIAIKICTCQQQKRNLFISPTFLSDKHKNVPIEHGSESDNLLYREPTKRSRKERNLRKSGFIDRTIITVTAGKGGDGAVAFDKSEATNKTHGIPSGGNGGNGGSVYITTSNEYSSLGFLSRHIKGNSGKSGKGSWMNGLNGKDMILRVPPGTLVREIRRKPKGDDFSIWTSSLDDIKTARELGPEDEQELKEYLLQERRNQLFVNHPGRELDQEHPEFLRIERQLMYEYRQIENGRQTRPLINVDLSEEIEKTIKNQKKQKSLHHEDKPSLLLARGGNRGYGNPHFHSKELRNPRIGTRGYPGETIQLELELKTIADIGLVGFPNAGKSTFLQAISNSKTQIAPYAFTTLRPHIGTIICYDNSKHKIERSRYTVADIPGLVEDASNDVGLGHDFLRHVVRSRMLVYVVDLSLPRPQDQIEILRNELEAYEPGLSKRARLVLANKADLVDSPQEGAQKIDQISKLVPGIDIVALSAAQKHNTQLLVQKLENELIKLGEQDQD